MCRIIVSRPDLWSTQFYADIAGILAPYERLSLPGARERIVWNGGDANPSRNGVVNWTNRGGAVVGTAQFWAALKAQVREATDPLADEEDEGGGGYPSAPFEGGKER